MTTPEFLEEAWKEAKRLLPADVYGALLQQARARAGGRARARARANATNSQCVEEDFFKAAWTAAFINDLPDSSFLYIEPGGEKDDQGKTVPRSLRHLPVKDAAGKVDLPHLRNALARLGQVEAPGMDKGKIRARAEGMLEEAKKSFRTVHFVENEWNALECARQEALVGEMGLVFQKSYLEPLGLTRADVDVSTMEQFSKADSTYQVVVALGREAGTKLGKSASWTLPHPDVVRKFGDTGEVRRKCWQIRKALANVSSALWTRASQVLPEQDFEDSGDSGDSVPVAKMDDEKQIVYGVVLDPYGNTGKPEPDAHMDWTPPKEVEKAAHSYARGERIVKIQHRDAADAAVVETWLEPYPEGEYVKACRGENHKIYQRKFGDDVLHSGSWVMGVQLGDTEWERFKSGELNAFSPGGWGSRAPLEKMPEVEVVKLVESKESSDGT